MPRHKAINWKSVVITMVGLALFSFAYILLTLFAVSVSPIEYKAPPDLVLQVGPSASAIAVSTDEHVLTPPAPTLTGTTDNEIETLAKGVLFKGQSREQFITLFGHPDQEVRAAAARALALCWTANAGWAEPRPEGPELMRRREFMENFWANAEKPTILKALLEVTSKSVETGGSEFLASDDQVLYLLAWFPGQESQRSEMLAWVANHHPRDGMRIAAMGYLVVNRNFAREIGDEVLDSRAHDPSTLVRFAAWKERIQRIPFGFFGGN